jgi:RNA polymerase sigma factor (sigma-70 family)
MGRSGAASGGGAGEGEAARFLRADPDLIEEVQAHAARIVHFKGFFIPGPEQAEIVQEVLAQIWKALAVKRLRLRGPVLALAETIACRRCVDWMRRHRAAEPIDERWEDRAPRPDQTLLRREREELGRRVLLSLGEPCRALIRLVLDERTPYAEIARRQGRSEHALRTKMWQCLREAREAARRLTAAPLDPEPGR